MLNMEEVFRGILRDELRTAIREELKNLAPTPTPLVVRQSDLLLTVPQVAARTEFDVTTVRAWISSKRLKASKPGGGRHYRVKESDLERFLAEEHHRPRLVGVPDADEEVARILAGVTRRR